MDFNGGEGKTISWGEIMERPGSLSGEEDRDSEPTRGEKGFLFQGKRGSYRETLSSLQESTPGGHQKSLLSRPLKKRGRLTERRGDMLLSRKNQLSENEGGS